MTALALRSDKRATSARLRSAELAGLALSVAAPPPQVCRTRLPATSCKILQRYLSLVFHLFPL